MVLAAQPHPMRVTTGEAMTGVTVDMKLMRVAGGRCFRDMSYRMHVSYYDQC